jgi:hypothetical protein
MLGGALLPDPAPDETQQRAMNMCDVLEVFAKKVCKTTNDGSIHISILVYGQHIRIDGCPSGSTIHRD